MGACEICWRRPATKTCPYCGRSVCEKHWDPERGACQACSETLCRICGKRLAHAYCIFCGRMGCDSCLVQLDNVRWACRECLARLGGRREALRILGLKRYTL